MSKQAVTPPATVKDINRPEWKIIVDLLGDTDPVLLKRLSRKMMNYLFKRKVKKISLIMEQFHLRKTNGIETGDLYGENQPAPRIDYQDLESITSQVFRVAEEELSPEEISQALQRWLRYESTRFLSVIADRRDVPLGQLREALEKYVLLPERNKKMDASEKRGIIVDLTRRIFTDDLQYINTVSKHVMISDFSKVLDHTIGPVNGNGKVGGKASGLFRAQQILESYRDQHVVLRNLKVPRTWFISSDSILEFIHINALEELLAIKYSDPVEIRQEYELLEQVFKHSQLPSCVLSGLNFALDHLGSAPLIVRSSSLLEDSSGAAFAGKYKSLFVANTGSRKERLEAISDAILEVYASVFGPDPIEYRRERGLLDFNEEMGILIQEVVGNRVGKYYFPPLAGVAFSRNDYRWSPRIKKEDGIVRLVTGLGTRAVDRTGKDFPVLMSPGQPNIRVSVSQDEIIRYAQKYMDVINLEKGCLETVSIENIIKECGSKFPCLSHIVSIDEGDHIQLSPGSMFNIENKDVVVTFHNLLEKSPVPLFFKTVLSILESEIGMPVDIEFAYGTDIHTPYLLQCRPQSVGDGLVEISIPTNIEEEDKLISADRYIMSGVCHNIDYIVYVDGDEYDSISSREKLLHVGRIIGRLNKELPYKKFVLIGPGRWGSKGDIKMGVHVGYCDINNTAMLIEVAKSKQGYVPDLSFGTHFFQDLVEANIKYLPVYPDEPGVIFREDIISNSRNMLCKLVDKAEDFEKIIRVTRISREFPGASMSVLMDGDSDTALAYLKR